jgi:LPXTG-motif cell wall-anchored protein
MKKTRLLLAALIMVGMQALYHPAVSQNTSNNNTYSNHDADNDNDSHMGWVGLLGLIGLAGLYTKRRSLNEPVARKY